MSLPTFTPPIAPQPGTSIDVTPKILAVDFGDGYTQVTADGLNHVQHKARLVWPDIHNVHATQIADFFAECGGTQPFLYQLPDDTVVRRWRCTRWTKDFNANRRRSVTAELVQDYGLAD